MAKINPPKGFKDLLPAEFSAREFLKKTISETYQRFGYQAIDTPAVENIDVLMGKCGGENEKLMFKVLKRGDKLTAALEGGKFDDLADLGLRFDLTVPLARFVASNAANLPPIFKRYQISPVWRADRPQHGRFREFYQCDVDIVGCAAMTAEADVIGATSECLSALGFQGLELRLNDRPMVAQLMRSLGVAEEKTGDACRALDKIDKVGVEGALEEMKAAGVEDGALDKIAKFHASLEGLDNAGILDRVSSALSGSGSEWSPENIREILTLCAHIDSVKIILDPFLVRGMDYYTGPIFEVRMPGVGFTLAGGGRYDKLIGAFSKRDIPATGFSIGFERILVLMKENGMFPEGQGGIDVVVVAESVEARGEYMKIAAEIRRSGLKADAALTFGQVGKSLADAEARGAKFGVVVHGKTSETVSVRNLKTRENMGVEIAGVGDFLRNMVDSWK